MLKALLSLLSVVYLIGCSTNYPNLYKTSANPLFLNSNYQSLKDVNSRLILLNFWSPNCAPCLEELGSLEALQRSLSPKQLRVIMVSSAAEHQQVLGFIRSGRSALSFVTDTEAALAKALSVTTIPHTFMLDGRSGELVGFPDPLSRTKTISVRGSRNWVNTFFLKYVIGNHRG